MPDLPNALQVLGIPSNYAQALSSILTVRSTTKRLVVRVRVGDLDREISAVIRGAIGQGATAVLHMSEGIPSDASRPIQ
jgi:hypothetical protein